MQIRIPRIIAAHSHADRPTFLIFERRNKKRRRDSHLLTFSYQRTKFGEGKAMIKNMGTLIGQNINIERNKKEGKQNVGEENVAPPSSHLLTF